MLRPTHRQRASRSTPPTASARRSRAASLPNRPSARASTNLKSSRASTVAFIASTQCSASSSSKSPTSSRASVATSCWRASKRVKKRLVRRAWCSAQRRQSRPPPASSSAPSSPTRLALPMAWRCRIKASLPSRCTTPTAGPTTLRYATPVQYLRAHHALICLFVCADSTEAGQ